MGNVMLRFFGNMDIDPGQAFCEALAAKLSCAERVFHPAWGLSALSAEHLWAWWRQLAFAAGSRHTGWRDPGVAVAILDARHLRRVGAYLALRPHAGSIRRCVDGSRLRALRDGLGASAFEILYAANLSDFGPPPSWEIEALGKIGYLSLDAARLWPCPAWRALARAAFPKNLGDVIPSGPLPEASVHQWLEECRIWLKEDACMSG